MDSEDGDVFVKNLASFVRTNEKALANALQLKSNEFRQNLSQGSGALGAIFSLISRDKKRAKLSLTPHNLFYLLCCFEELGINVGPMKVRLKHSVDDSSTNYVSFLRNASASRPKAANAESSQYLLNGRGTLGISGFGSVGIGRNVSEARRERQKAALLEDQKYLYSAFTKIPCLRLAPDLRAPLIRGYEEFPFDSAVPLYSFKNLQALEISSIDYRQFFGWDRLSDQLRSLTLKRSGFESTDEVLIDIVLDDMDKRRRRRQRISPNSDHTPRRNKRISRSGLPRAASEPGVSSHHVANEAVIETGRKITKQTVTEADSSRQGGELYPNTENAPGTLPPSKWRFLRHICVADNSLTSLSSHGLVALSNTLYSLDISSNLFSEIPDSLKTLTSLQALNASYNVIESLYSLTRGGNQGITVLNLRGNRLQSLAGIEKLRSLERLDLRDNRLTDPVELARLTACPNMREVYVEGNPFTRTHRNYRAAIFNLFRNAPGYSDDIVIDGTGPTSSEKQQLVERCAPPPLVPIVRLQSSEAHSVDESKVSSTSMIRKKGKSIAETLNSGDTSRAFTSTHPQVNPDIISIDSDVTDKPSMGDTNFNSTQTSPRRNVDLGTDALKTSGEADADSKQNNAYTKDKSVAQISDSGYASRAIASAFSEANTDAMSIYSDISHISMTTVDEYKSQLVSRLITAMDILPSDADTLQSCIPHLAPVFQSFGRRLHGEAQSRMQRNAAVFINKHQGRILDLFGDRLEGEQVDQPGRHPGMPVNEVSKWVEGIQNSGEEENGDGVWDEEWLRNDNAPWNWNEPADGGNGDKSTHVKNGPNFEEHWNFIQATAAYKWLLSRIHRQIHLSTPSPNHMRTIGQTLYREIWGHAPTNLRHVSRDRTPGLFQVDFSIDWDPIKFLREQEFDVPLQDAFRQTICLTGSWLEAQATSCEQYMEQTWPLTSEPIMSLLDALVTSETQKCTYESPNGLHLSGAMQNGILFIEVIGILDMICEIGEQLGWLGSALRSSTIEEGIVVCCPHVKSLEIRTGKVRSLAVRMRAACDLTFSLESATLEHSQPGFCWSKLFRNPILVVGYPVPRRAESNPGLEIPINVMAQLVRSRTISTFCGRKMIKGFCSVLMPMVASAESITWHLFFNPDGTRISYVDHRFNDISDGAYKNISIRDIENKRHILGWCASIFDFTGHSEANFEILTSGLPPPPSSTTLENAYIEAGDYVMGGLSVALSKKDKPTRFQSRVDYIEMVDWISSQAVVLYDVLERRAWLVDGASAVLHLVRASLVHDSSRPAFKSSWLFDSSKLNADSNQLDNCANSVEVLVDEDNRNLPIYLKSKRTGQCSHFEDRVQDILHYLQQMIDHQSEVEHKDGLWLRNSFKLRKNLIGFDFYDIATRGREVWPRIQYLRETGYGWVDFVRKVKAVTLFGSGFGELLKPLPSTPLCPEWRAAPKNQDYLAASISLLKMLHMERRAPDLGGHEIVRDIVWASPHKLFKPCDCVSRPETTAHSDPVQIFLPKGSKLFPRLPKPLISPCNLDGNGAVIFGHNKYLKIRWPNEGGAPVEGEPSTDGESQHVVTDTGAGFSTTQDSLSPSDAIQSLEGTTTTSMTELTESNSEIPQAKDGGRDSYKETGKSKWQLPVAIYTLDAFVTQSRSPWGLPAISNREPSVARYSCDDSAGEGTYAYIADSGIDMTHDDFSGCGVQGYNGVGGTLKDTYGHGTHVAGIIEGEAYGVAKRCNLIDVKVFVGRQSTPSATINGFAWAADHIIAQGRQGRAIINLSCGVVGPSATIWTYAINAAFDAGILSIVASGNQNVSASIRSPANAQNALTAGAIEEFDLGLSEAWYSNYGDTVHVLAPGSDVESTSIGSSSATEVQTGTSMAASNVAGVALYLANL